MAEYFTGDKLSYQGYIYNAYGGEEYLRHAAASVKTLRRYDRERPTALFCTPEHIRLIEKFGLEDHFSFIFVLPDEHQSITGFKHNLHHYMPFDQNLFLDSDIIWCKNPEPLWDDFQSHPFTITGNQSADVFFGSHKGWKIIKDLILRTRRRTLKRFGVSYLSRVQTGMIFARDRVLTEQVCTLAGDMLTQRGRTHFRSRKDEKGRKHESCEWSLALAMAKLQIQVYPWLYGYRSPQLDFIEAYTIHDKDFTQVSCLLYSDRFVYDMKSISNNFLRKTLISVISLMPGKGDYLYVTPFCLHFGWYNQKKKFREFSDAVWVNLIKEREKSPA